MKCCYLIHHLARSLTNLQIISLSISARRSHKDQLCNSNQVDEDDISAADDEDLATPHGNVRPDEADAKLRQSTLVPADGDLASGCVGVLQGLLRLRPQGLRPQGQGHLPNEGVQLPAGDGQPAQDVDVSRHEA